jgi:hypothetical protein
MITLGFIAFKPISQIQIDERTSTQLIQTENGLIEKQYDTLTKTVSMTNLNTSKTNEIKLNTPLVYEVGAGYQKVAELEFNSYEDFKTYLSNSNFELINLNTQEPITRQLDFKYKTFKNVSINDYITQCDKFVNGSDYCDRVVIGNHIEQQESWKDLNEYSFKSGEPVKIGIFTNVELNDHVEWIPTFYGVKIQEWAEWIIIISEHSLPMTLGGGSRTGASGVVINFTTIQNITAVKKVSTSDVTQCYIRTAYNGTNLSTASFVGDWCNFTTHFVANTSVEYIIVADKNGSAYNLYLNVSSGFLPILNNSVWWKSGYDYNGAADPNLFSIEAIAITNSTTTTTNTNIVLVTPENNTIFSSANISFTAFYNISVGTLNWTNTTYYIWNQNGSVFNITTRSINGTNNQSTLIIENFSVGNYKWNVKGGYGNSTFLNYTWANENFTFLVGATISSLSYNNQTYETSTETFSAIFTLASGSQISLAQLVYNGTDYTITNLSQVGTTLTLSKTIDIPINLVSLTNQTNNFKFRFTYGGGSVQETSNLQQNVSFINFQNCNATYSTQALNFTFFNEINQTKINGTSNPTNFESNWKYWLGTGTTNRSYTFQNLSSSFVNYTFCIHPYQPNNYTFKIDGDIDYSAISFRENEYHLRNATLTNVSSDILLYLIHTDFATKFFLTFRQGTDLISGATVTVQKFFTGLGTFNTVSVLSTDDGGESTMWQEVDKTYRYSIIKDGVLLGVVEKVSICSVSPCSLTITIPSDFSNPYASYYDYYSQNVLSNLSYNKTSHIVTYDFIDTTGLANYFRLKVIQARINQTGTEICNSQSFSTAGTLSCNLTGYSGEFTATGYISRSPEKVDKVLAFLTDDEAIASLGLLGIFLIMALIITLVFAGAIVGKGSPSVVLGFLGIGILGLKLGGLFPFSWVVVVTLEVLILFFISKVKA